MGAVSSLFQRMGQVLSKDTPKNGALAAQLEGVSKVMQTMGSQMDIQLRFERDLEGGLRELLNKYGFRVQEVTAYQSAYGMLTVRLAMGGCSTKSGCAARLVKVVSEACRVPMRIVGKQCPGQGAKSCKVVLEERAMLRADVGLVVRPCGGQVLCGDTVASVGWSSSHHMLCLSDGMGTGRDAHEHSEATVRLLIDMMEAGVGRDAAFKALNQFMQLKGPGEMFSTIDLCQINLLEARAEFVKVGAVPSYLLRDGSVQCLKSASLPIGIVDDVTYQRMDYGLRPRDVIVLMSDGIYDAIGEENMDRVLTGLETKMPAKRIADALIGLAIARRQTKEEDDMSVIVARIGKA